MREELLKVAVIEGFHPFDVIHYHQLFRSLEGIDYYPQTIENWAVDWAEFRAQYDVLLFYNMNMKTEETAFPEPVEAALQTLGKSEQGIVMLHHSILAFPEHAGWSKIVGIENRQFGFHPDQQLDIQVADSSHPITEGISSWSMQDESYTMDEPDKDSHILLTTRHPKSMKALAWTRQHEQSRVFCFQSGHGKMSWLDDNFRRVLLRGIQWAAWKIG
jgi:type 1 glutamine amidotransferase